MSPRLLFTNFVAHAWTGANQQTNVQMASTSRKHALTSEGFKIASPTVCFRSLSEQNRTWVRDFAKRIHNTIRNYVLELSSKNMYYPHNINATSTTWSSRSMLASPTNQLGKKKKSPIMIEMCLITTGENLAPNKVNLCTQYHMRMI